MFSALNVFGVNFMEVKKERFCPCCGQTKGLQNFIVDYRNKDKYLPFCKTCTDFIVNKASDNQLSVVGIWAAAMVNNVPMIKYIWDEAKKIIAETNPKSPFAVYYRVMREKYGNYEGVWQSDCWVGDFLKIVAKNSEGIVIPSIDEIQSLVKDWGKFLKENGEYDYEAYDYLSKRYEEYVENAQGLTNAMSMQYRNLCKAEWLKIKADESGDITEVSKAQKLLDSLYSQLKLDDFAIEKSDTDRFIDRLIWRIEETEPAEIEDENKYVDVAGHERNYNSIMRSLKNIVANSRDYPEVPTEEL